MSLKKLKNNLLFYFGITLLILAIVFPAYEILLGSGGAIVVLIWFFFNVKLKIKQIINLFRGY